MKPKLAIPPIRRQIPTDTSWAKSDKEEAELFGAHLATVFTAHSGDPDLEINRLLASIPNKTYNLNILTLHEIQKGITTLNNKKTPGPDLVTPKMLKELPRKGLIALLYIFNGILRTQHWPKVLNTAEIILIHKPGKDPNDPASYRPISLLSTISKVLERIIASKIITDDKYVNSIPGHQFGIRHKHSTIQQVHRTSHTINEAFEKKKYCTSAFKTSAKPSTRYGTKAYSLKSGTRYHRTLNSWGHTWEIVPLEQR